MPYIDPERRKVLDLWAPPQGPGELNYLLTRIATAYLEKRGKSYQTINDIMGAFEGAKLEFYRRIAAPYENNKRDENGDVY